MLFMLALTGSMEVKAQETSDFHFNSGVRYSQWVTKSRMNSFYRNKNADGFAVYDADGKKTAEGNTAFDYVPGLVAKAIVENVQYYSQYSWAQSWAKPFFYSMADYCNAYYNSVPTSGGSLDNLNASKVFFGMYDLTKDGGAYNSTSIASTINPHANTALGRAMTGFTAHNTSYKIANTTSAYLAGHTIVENGWYHKSEYVDEMWLDGSYMGPALFAQLRNYKGSDIISDDWTIVYRQIQALWDMCWNNSDKLLYHAFAAAGHNKYSNTWSGFNTGSGVYHSASYWGRACGWYFLALIDILEQMDAAGLSDTANYATLQSHLSELAAGLAARQDATTGCWYQILDETSSYSASSYNNGKSHSPTNNYLESSASALFTAGYLKAIRKGYLLGSTVPAGCSNNYETIAKNGYKGLVNNFFAADGSEGVHLFGSCRSAGLGKDVAGKSNYRDGSKAYYLLGSDVARVAKSENVTEGKILGAFIFAATEYERLYQDNTVLFEKDLAPSYELEAGDEISCPASGSGANITYQWYKDGVAVEDATNATIAPTASGAYYCKATSGTTTIQSSTTNVTVPGVDTETPVFTTDLAATATATVGTAKTLTVAASHADGYQWYSNTTASNTSGTEIENATSASYTFTPSAAGTLYYYCVATNSNATGTQSVASAVCTVTVSEAPAETTYTVTFNATTNGGTCATASITQASSGASITLPTATKSGYTFNGWYTASTGGTLRGAANASYTPTADETLYAQFTENSGTGGATESITWSGSSLTGVNGTNVTAGTATAVDGSTYKAGTISINSSKIETESKKHNDDSYWEDFSSGTQSASSTNATTTARIEFPINVADGYTFNVSEVDFKVEQGGGSGPAVHVFLVQGSTSTWLGYTAAGTITWNNLNIDLESGSAKLVFVLGIGASSNLNNGRAFKFSNIAIKGTSSQAGGSTPTTYTVSYNMNGHGTAIDAVEGVTALPSTLPTPEATGYTFGGWYTNSGLTSAATAGASISADTELYAKWTANTYSVHFDANGGEGSMTNESFTYGIEKALTANAFTRTGYKFDGWATSANGAKVYDNSQSVSNLTATNGATVDLYAHWTEKAAATVSINPASGNVTVGSTLDISSYVTAGSSTGAISYSTGDASKATVTNAGVITGVAEGETTIIVTQAETEEYTAGSATFTITVTATPTTNYIVTFYNGNTFYGSLTIDEGATVEAPAISPTKQGYTFKGWALENGSTARVLFPYLVYSDVNFYAVWSEDTGGGSGEDVEIYSATATAGLNVPAYTTSGMEITSDNATIKGGKLYVYNGQDSGKNLITNEKGSTYAFLMTNSDTFFKVSLDKALAVGDKIKADIYGPKINNNNEEQPRGLWLTTASSRPKSAPTATLSVTNTSTSSDAWMASSDYIVTTDDGICGETTFYIYRATGNSTYFTDFTITREGQGDDITLDAATDYENFDDYVGANKNVTLRRNFTEGNWTTLVLPFSVTTEQLVAAFDNADKCELAKIKSMSVDAQGKGSIHYTTVSSIEANKPVLAKIMPNESGKYVFSGVMVVNPTSVVSTSTDKNVEMHGVYKTTGYTQISEDAYFLSGGKFYDWSYLSNMSPFSAYILPVGANAQSIQSINFEDEATGIENVNANGNGNANENESYNLAGQRVTKEYNGIVIIKGKKVFTK